MNNTTTPTEKQKDDENFKSDLKVFHRIFLRFGKSDFEKRRKTLNIIRELRKDSIDQDWINVNVMLETPFLDKHIKLTIQEVREKYGITQKPTAADFRRICEGERILIVNDVPNKKTEILERYPLYVNAPLGQTFLAFDGRLKGKELLRSQFQLLGNHFLHQDEMPPMAEAFDECEKIYNTRREEAMQFAIQFVDTKPEVEK